ncbi:MAG: TIM barrel protein [Nanoarchaeota archaeon]|nr:TIM barrel protein [Nanoarchaeota archaeon]
MSSYESIYEGAPSYLIPRETSLKYLSAGYQSTVSNLGLATDPRTANQLGEMNIKLNPGQRHMEVGAINQSVMDSIPDQHLDEIRRLSKMTGVKTSLHMPIVEPSGVGEREWNEANRIFAERQVASSLIRAHKLEPDGNMIVTTHSSGILPETVGKYKGKNPDTGEIEEIMTEIYVVDPESGKIGPFPVTKKYFPKEGEKFEENKPRKFDFDDELKKINEDQWQSQITDINRLSNFADDALHSIERQIPKEVFSKITDPEFNIDNLPLGEGERDFLKNAQRHIVHGQIYLKDAYRLLKANFDKAYTNAEKDDKEKLNKFAEDAQKMMKPGFEKDPESMNDLIDKGVKVLQNIDTPKIYKPLKEFAMEKSSETFANAVSTAYKKFGDTTPILSIENPPAGGGFSRAEDLKELIEKTRKKLKDNLVTDGMSSSEAENTAKKLVGATWDVGHINMIRKKGYSEEDVIKESEIIAPFVKHVHLSDNFGLEHTELPMGMGNVPMKEIMEKLGQKGFSGKKIVEAGNWWQYFSEKGGGNPFRPSLEAFDSPLYSIGGGPYWSQLGAMSAYYMGHGPINPAVHHKIYGSGFEGLPLELGGEIPGDKGRFSGTPNQ